MKLVHLILPLQSNRVSRLDGESRERESEASIFRFQNFRVEPSLNFRGLASKIDRFTIRNHCFVAIHVKLIFPFIAKVNNTYKNNRFLTYYIHHASEERWNQLHTVHQCCVPVMWFPSHFDIEEEEQQHTRHYWRGDRKEHAAKRFLISSRELEIV